MMGRSKQNSGWSDYYDYVNAAALARYPALLRQWLPAGQLAGNEYECGDVNGTPGKSFKVNVQTGQWADFAGKERGGDPISLFAAINHLTQGRAGLQLGRELGLKPPNRASLSLAELASAKKFPVEWLQDHGVADFPNGSGVAIGYFYEDERQAERLRKRTALKAKDGSSWTGSKGVSPIPYGVWLLKNARAKRQLIVVEGETDCWALWFHGYPALGMPGAKNIKGLLLDHLREIDCLYVVQEPDAAGSAFPGLIAHHARKLGYKGDIRSITLPDGAKDPCDLHIAGNFETAFVAALNAAIIVNESVVNSEELRPPGFSDDALAAQFAKRFASTLRYVAKWGRWFEYGGSRWAEDDTLHAFDLSRRICREAASEIAEEQHKLAMAIASAKTVAAVERLSRSDRCLAGTIDQWDADLMLLNTPAGTVDLRTGQVRPNRRDDYCTKITAAGPADYADCPLWLSFLGRIFAENDEFIAYVKRLCGYMLTGSTIEQQFCFFFGIGANGKSVLTNTLMGVLSGYAKTTASETFMASKGERHLTEVADLRGARLVVASETETGRRWAESRLKEITGATPISARFMRQDLFEYIPQLKLVIVGNHRPHLSAIDEAIRRRLHLVPFTVVVPKGERDLHLAEKLKAEWPAILRWMIDGCLEWQAEGLNPPTAVREATDAYFENEDSLGEWIAEACDQGANYQARIKELFPSWKSFAEVADDFVGTKRSFADALENRGFKRRKIGQERDKGFLGLKLKDIFSVGAKNADVSTREADQKDSANILGVTRAHA